MLDEGDITLSCVSRGKQGTVMYIFRSFLFLHSRERVENAGVFVVRARECKVIGGTGGKSSTSLLGIPSR